VRFALISDIHGNLEALTAVLKDVEKRHIEAVHCLGDVIGYGSEPIKCLHLINQFCDIKLLGNHEYVVLGKESEEAYTEVAKVSSQWTREQLTDKEMSMIASFGIDYMIEETYLVHASPYQPSEWHYVLSPDDAQVAFQHMPGKICFHGHTHVPIVFTYRENDIPRRRVGHSFHPDEESRYLVNIGSVGQPRDNDPRASYVTYDTEAQEVGYHRVEYDISTAQKKMAEARLPSLLIDRLAVGR
jgi:predicted phosphodiesterase